MRTIMTTTATQDTETLISMLRAAAADLSPSVINALIARPDARTRCAGSNGGTPRKGRSRQVDARRDRNDRAGRGAVEKSRGSQTNRRSAHHPV